MATREEIREGIADILEEYMIRKIALLVADAIMEKQDSQGVVIKVDGELPCEENNMGNMNKQDAFEFFYSVREVLGIDLEFDTTPTSPSICLGDKILLCEKDLQYPWFTKQMILHEITHHLVPEAKAHGTKFHKKYAELVNRFLAGYKAVEPLIKE